MITRRLIELLLLALAAAACRSPDPESRVVFVAPTLVDCGTPGRHCLLVSEDFAAGWQLWENNVEGFAFEPGYFYELQVIETAVEDPAGDGPDRRWVLESVLGQDEATIRTEWISAEQVSCAGMEDGTCYQVWDARGGGWKLLPFEIQGFVPAPGLHTRLTVADRHNDGVWTALQVLDQSAAPPTPAAPADPEPTFTPSNTSTGDEAPVAVSDMRALTFQPAELPALGIATVVPLGWGAVGDGAWSGENGLVNITAEPGVSARAVIDQLLLAMTAADGPSEVAVVDSAINGRSWTIATRPRGGQTATAAATALEGGQVVVISLFVPPEQHAAILQAMLESFSAP